MPATGVVGAGLERTGDQVLRIAWGGCDARLENRSTRP